MKETEQRFSEKIENIKQAKKEIQKILIGKLKPQKNHSIFEINVENKTIELAKFDTKTTITFAAATLKKQRTNQFQLSQIVFIYLR